MRTIFAVYRQAMKAAFRSRVFFFLLGLSLLAATAIPLTIRGDGTAVGAVQAGLTYSLQAVGVLLSLAAVWLGCAGLSKEIENYTLHMVITKPVSAVRLWLGKYLGVLTVTAVPMVLCGLVIYGLMAWKLNSEEFSEEELERARREVLVGRLERGPVRQDFYPFALQRYDELAGEGRLDPDHDKDQVVKELLRQIKAASTEVGPSQVRRWHFAGLTTSDASEFVFFRYRVYVDSTSSSRQRTTFGVWHVVNPDKEGQAEGEAVLPQRAMGGSFHELKIPFELVGEDGGLIVEYLNRDPREASVIFQLEDGPIVLIPLVSFSSNFSQGILMLVVRIALLAVLGCAMGAMFSSPVAVFVAMTYLLLSVVADTVFRDTPSRKSDSGVPYGYNLFSYGTAVAVDTVIISLRDFDAPGRLSRGYLIGWRGIGRVLAFQLALRGLPLAALGVFVLHRRELGKVVRK
jgi:hypothetical protein